MKARSSSKAHNKKNIMKGEYLNVILLSLTIVVMIIVCMLHIVYKTMGCRASCWFYGIKIKYLHSTKQKRASVNNAYDGNVQYTNNDEIRLLKNDDVSNNYGGDDNIVVDNVDNTYCCIHLAWTRYDSGGENDIITLPDAQKIQYGRLQQQNSFCCKALVGSFPTQGKNETCPICLDPFEDGGSLILLKCCHGYHEQCFTSWLQSASKSKVSCPMCKREIHADGIQEKTPLTISTFSHVSSASYSSYLGYSHMIGTHV